MSWEELQRYKALCSLYGWKFSIKGLKAYHKQTLAGLRELWAK